MEKQRVIDGNELLEIESLLNTDIIQKSKEASWLMSQVLHDIAAMPTIDPETMPIVQQLRAELKQVKAERDAAMSFIPKTCATCKYGNSPCDWCVNDPDGDLNCEWDGKSKEWKEMPRSPYPDGDDQILSCWNCGSGEYLYNEDGNRNDYCGQCGQKIDWGEEKND